MDQMSPSMSQKMQRDRPTMARDLEIDLADILRIFLRRKWIFLWTVLLITGACVAVVLQLPQKYTATLQLYFEAENPTVVDFEAALSGQPQDAAAILSEMEVLKSRSLAQRLVEKLDLDQDPEFNSKLRPESFAKRVKDTSGGFSPNSHSRAARRVTAARASGI